MIVFAHVKMDHMVVNLAAKCVYNAHEACAASFGHTVVEDDCSFSTWCKLRKVSEI
jgi:hypothetical protein